MTSGGLGIIMCRALIEDILGLATILCHARLYSFACHAYVSAPGSLARYKVLHYTAAGCARCSAASGCAYAAAPNEFAWHLASTHAAAGCACAAAPEGTARSFAN